MSLLLLEVGEHGTHDILVSSISPLIEWDEQMDKVNANSNRGREQQHWQ